MGATYFQDFIRDNGLPITVEYAASGGESDFDYPGHICDGGGSGLEIEIVHAWPNTAWHNRLAGWELSLWNPRTRAWHYATDAIRLALCLVMRLDEWWRATLTAAEIERFTAWLAESHVDEPWEPDF